jgi:hypothetical protein
MQHNLAEEAIRKELADYLTGKTSLRDFYDWFAVETWDIHEWAPAQVQDTVSRIKLLLAEYSSGHWSKAELKEQFRPLLTSLNLTLRPQGSGPTRLVQPQPVADWFVSFSSALGGTVQLVRQVASGSHGRSAAASV